ncbi:hypothetical protein I6N95_11565 [Vagococcus sp. BWB3-3]|uniref:Uncharacterized protein n=1 Tax=Vagococcus allomyrinae TaxID=2794353 RepID=A0A940P5Y3_9ENTE|nr:hypothetical protein [Vagococcus allomyrinae]MBP1041645.1 hypothetical protein [Vagococcus allomyrinae]
MFFDFDFVIVEKFERYESKRIDRKHQLLTIKLPHSKQKLCFVINRYVNVPHLKKGDRVRLRLEIFVRGRSTTPLFKVVAIFKENVDFVVI